MNNFKFSSTSLSRMEGVDRRLIAIAHRAIQITPFDFGIPTTGGLRSEAQQKALFDDGVSQLDGCNKKSYHQTGKALDFFAYTKEGVATWDEYHLAMVAAAFLQSASELGYKLEWGGLWEYFKDFPHVQLVD